MRTVRFCGSLGRGGSAFQAPPGPQPPTGITTPPHWDHASNTRQTAKTRQQTSFAGGKNPVMEIFRTRMHSSRMRTARSLTVSPSMLCIGGCTWSQGVCVPGPGGCTCSQGGTLYGGWGGVYLVLGGVPGPGGVCLVLGVCAWSRGVNLVPRGVYLVWGGCTWSWGGVGPGTPPDQVHLPKIRPLLQMVRILLECILV